MFEFYFFRVMTRFIPPLPHSLGKRQKNCICMPNVGYKIVARQLLIYRVIIQTIVVCAFCLFRRYLTRELIWHTLIFHKALKDRIIAFLAFSFSFFRERASVSLLMLSAKQGNHWYQVQHLWYDAIRYRGLNFGPPALGTSTLKV